MDSVIECLQDKGWAVTRSAGGDSFTATYSNDQEDQYLSQRDECYEVAREELGPRPELTEEQVADLFDRQVSTAECLEAQGFNIPEPPSKQVWVEQVLQGGDPAWYPFNYLKPEEAAVASEKCPEPYL